MSDEQRAEQSAQFPDGANASPTKQFFVNMLVRDIELKDTLLDLLDNCVDGILRSCEPNLADPKPYAGFRADIVVSPEQFIIEDNCGGIPVKIAEESAFAIGKPVPIRGADSIATVGMYGIGMKRAIFKLGSDAVVQSWNDQAFSVHIDADWLKDQDWQRLPMAELEDGALPQGHTRIRVTELDPAVKAEFEQEFFASDLIDTIAQNYSIIIEKGFEVTVRKAADAPLPDPVEPIQFKLLKGREGQPSEGVRPYVYVGEIDGVQVEVYAGLYRELPDEEERENEEETRGSSDEAGWTVACNDRIVVWKDRTRLTGWGESTVPNFHGQFIAITGLVLLHSADPKRLPLTTTKRGLDAGSDIYSKVKDMMREATKGLTGFTNKWKKFETGLEDIYKGSDYVELGDLRQEAVTVAQKPYHKYATMKRFVPNLPAPATASTGSRVSFVAPKSDIAALSFAYFGGASAKPKEVGEEAFRREVAIHQLAAE